MFLFSRKFFPFFVAQFFGAYNDNLFKNILLTLIAYRLTEVASSLGALTAAVFILPYFLFSAFAGCLADTWNRANLARVYKTTELGLMALVGLLLPRLLPVLDNPETATLPFWGAVRVLMPLLVVLFLMGAQSAFWSPVKYAWLPHMLERKDLMAGNAVIEASTYFAIVIGTICGAFFSVGWTVGVLLCCAAVGLFGSLFMPSARPPHRRDVAAQSMAAIVRTALHTRLLRQTVLGITWFWMLGTFVLTQLFPLCSDVFGFPRPVLGYFLLVTTVGIGVGSFLCAKLIKGRIRTSYLPISSLLVTGAFLGVAAVARFADPVRQRALTITLCTLLFLLFASAGGLFVVPLNTLLQAVTPKGLTARVVAGNNIVNAIGMVIISLACVALAQLGLSIAALFLVAGLASALVTAYCCRLFPGELTRLFVRSLLRACFRVRVDGAGHLDNLPPRVIIIANHVSLLDGLLVGACLPFRATFVMDKAWSEKWWVRPVRWFTDVLTVNAGSPRAVAAMVAGVKAGRRIVIFPEGCITTTGELSPIQPGAAFVASRADAALLPIRIDGAIRSRLSYMKGKIPLRLFPKVSLTVSPCQTLPTPDTADPAQLRDIQSQSLNAIMHRFCKTDIRA